MPAPPEDLLWVLRPGNGSVEDYDVDPTIAQAAFGGGVVRNRVMLTITGRGEPAGFPAT